MTLWWPTRALPRKHWTACSADWKKVFKDDGKIKSILPASAVNGVVPRDRCSRGGRAVLNRHCHWIPL
jgi:hypothetical protein